MTRLYVILSGVVCVLIGAAFMAGRWTAPKPPTAVQEAQRIEAVRQVVVTKYVDRIITRTKHTVETKAPDGASTTTTDETENDHTQSAEIPPPPDKIGPVLTATLPREANWRVSASVGLTINLQSSIVPVYGAEVDRRLIGPMWLGIRANTGGYVGAALGIEF